MSYERDKKDRMKEFVETAIASYISNINNAGAGYSILRYAKAGYIALSKDANPQEFVDWYPLNQGFVILRLARRGLLKYKEQENA